MISIQTDLNMTNLRELLATDDKVLVKNEEEDVTLMSFAYLSGD